MTRIIEHRQDDVRRRRAFELRVFQLKGGDVRACVVPSDLAMTHTMMAGASEPVGQAYLDALALCEREGIATSWVHDLLGLFRHRIDRSGNCDGPVAPITATHARAPVAVSGRRAWAREITTKIGNHTFRATGVTAT